MNAFLASSGFFGAVGDVLRASITYETMMRLAALLAFAAIGEWIAERAGTLNISIEAMILTGAFAAAFASGKSNSALVALVAAGAAGWFVGLVQATLSHRLTANQFVVGLTLNVLAVGLTAFLNAQLKPKVHKTAVWRIPGLVHLPIIGRALFGQTWVLYLLYPLIPAAWYLVYRTRWGLEVRSVGENPQAADVSGVHVNKRRRQAVCIAGITSGLGGAFLTIGQVGSFGADGVSGRGFIAIAAVIFGGWKLKGVIGGCLLFGAFDALRPVVQSLGHPVNAQLLAALPYIITLSTMLLFAHRTSQPRALAQPFVRGLT